MKERNAILAFTVIAVVASGVGAGIIVLSYKPTLTLQTTTSMQDSGLLDRIKPAFDAKYGVNLRWVAVGTGQALINAALGQGDVVIVHSNSSECAFINHTDTSQVYSGYGIFRVHFAYNYFIVVGPVSDPLDISGSEIEGNATGIFKLIYTAGHDGTSGVLFASRGDASGTYNKEVSLWNAAKVWNKTTNWPKNEPKPSSWYKSTGKGMGPTLIYANEVGAYTLADYGTWLNMRDTLTNLKVVSTLQCKDLLNTYSVIAVDPQKISSVKFDLAKKFIYFMAYEAQDIIGNYTIDGEQVFYKWVSPDCFCGSPLCDVCNGSYYTYTPAPSHSQLSCTDCSTIDRPVLHAT